jgi:hypothetical protein
MKQLFRLFLAISIVVTLIAGTALAQQHGTAAEAKQMVQEGLAYIAKVGPEKAFVDFSNTTGKWHNKDIYLFCYKSDGTCVCNGDNPVLLGKNLIDFRYADGQTHIKEMVDLANSKGSGWVDYPWPQPQTKKLEAKRSWVVKIPNYDGFIAAGIYK